MHDGMLINFVLGSCVFFFSQEHDFLNICQKNNELQSSAGSIVSMLLEDDRLGTSKDLRLQLINTMLAEYFDEHPGTHRLPPLRLANVTSDGWANLQGPAIKAANVGAAVPAF